MLRNIVFGKSVERLRRKAIGPVKWQPVATLEMHCLRGSASFFLAALKGKEKDGKGEKKYGSGMGHRIAIDLFFPD